MNTVGPDGRTQYYQLTPAEVIADLKSHKMGLTNAEAGRRLKRGGSNVFNLASTEPHGRALRQTLVISSAVAFGTALLALATQQSIIACILLASSLTYSLLAYYLSRQLQLPLEIAGTYIPTHAKVLRNGQVTTLKDASKVVLGDIIKLEAGDIVPADVRLLTADDLVLDAQALTGNHNHIRGYTHALGSMVSVFARHNTALLGSRVVSGEGYGIVVATSSDTELGRSLLAAAAYQQQPTWFEHYLLRFAQASLAVAIIGSLTLAWLAWTNGINPTNLITALLTLFAALAPLELVIVTSVFIWHAVHKARQSGLHMKGLYALDQAQAIDMLLLDPTAFSDGTTTAAQMRIGHTVYDVSGQDYEPVGTITNASGKPLTKKELRELSLFFEASALAHHTAIVAADAHQTNWRVHGNHTEGALLTLARKAGLQTETLRLAHELRKTFPFDRHRHMASAVRTYGDDTVTFVYGQPDVVLSQSAKLWDHGHIRALSTADHNQFVHHQTVAAAEGLHTLALAYRILPKRTVIDKLTAAEVEQKLILLGFVDVASSAHTHAISVLQAARAADAKVSLLSTEPQPYGLDSERLRAMSDTQVLERLRKGTATFTGLAPEEKLRLIRVAQAAHHHIALASAELAYLPALLAADTGVTTPTAPALVQAAATIVTSQPDMLFCATHISRRTMQRLYGSLRAAVLATAGLASLALLSGTASFAFHTPAILTPAQILALSILVLPLVLTASALQHPKLARSIHERQYEQRTVVGFGALSGCLAFAGFLAFFAINHLSPAYINANSRLSLAASTIVVATFVLCQLVNTLSTRSKKFQIYMALLCTIALGLVIFSTYWQPAESALHLMGLNSLGWLISISLSAIYALFIIFEHYSRQHARHSVIELYHNIFDTTRDIRGLQPH